MTATTPSAPAARRGRPKNEDLAELDARITRASSALFFSKGYGETTTAAVAAAARVSKATLYARFPSKAALFRAIVAEQTRSWEFGANRIHLAPHETLEEVLNSYGDIALQAGLSQDFIQLDRLVHSEAERFPELAEAAATRFEIGVRYVAGYIRTYAERDRLPCRDPEAIAERFLMMLMGWCGVMVQRKQEISRDARREWLNETVRHFVHGRAAW